MVTEDPITKIWAKSYGIDCLNVNEAELLIFQNYDVNLFRLYNPYANDGDDFDPSTNICKIPLIPLCIHIQAFKMSQ